MPPDLAEPQRGGVPSAPPVSPPADEIKAYMHLSREEIARLVLCLLIEDALQSQLAGFRSQNLPAKPVQS